jgi:hypothetical protein
VYDPVETRRQVARVREMLSLPIEDKLDRLSPGTYRRLQVVLAAATGDYARADDDLRVLATPPRLAPGKLSKNAVPAREALALETGKFILLAAADPKLAAAGLPVMTEAGALVLGLRQQAEALALGGLLALERGEASDAGRWFREALDVWRGPPGGALGLAHHYLDLLEASRR